MARSVQVTVNGQPRELGEGATVAALVEELGHDPGRPGVAVAVAGEVVPRSDWWTYRLDDGVAVEVVGAAQGG